MSFLLIPFRVIVSKILPFYEMKVGKKSPYFPLNDFDLFGYFSKDKTRKIFFIFSSIVFKSRYSVIIDFSKLVHISYLNKILEEGKMDELVEKSPIMKNLVSLGIHFDYGVNDRLLATTYNNLFTRKDCFPSLKKFVILDKSFQELRIKTNRWNECEHVWQNLLFFHWSLESSDNSVENYRFLSKLSKAKKVILADVRPNERISVCLQEIEDISVNGCGNIDFVVGRKLTNFKCRNSDSSIFDQIALSDNLKHISYSPKSEDIQLEPSLFKRFFAGKLSQLTYVELSSLKFPDYYFSFGTCLKVLKLCDVEGFDEELLFRTELPNLENFLLIEINEFVGKRVFPFCKNLKRFDFIILENFDEEFFVINEFDKLEYFDLYRTKNVTGTRLWANFPNVTELVIEGCDNLKDQCFNVNGSKFPKLESFHFANCPILTGDGWEPEFTQNLKEMGIRYCKSFKPSFFLKNEHLPVLEELHMSKVKGFDEFFDQRNMTSSHEQHEQQQHAFNGFRNLKKVELLGCKVTDKLFQSDVFVENLKHLVIRQKVMLDGIGWRYLPKLEVIRLESAAEKFEFVSRNPFGENVEMSYTANMIWKVSLQQGYSSGQSIITSSEDDEEGEEEEEEGEEEQEEGEGEEEDIK